jgi:thiosulfate sulfurtransferase
MDIPQIERTEARALLASGEAVFIDIRDEISHCEGHIVPSLRLDEATLGPFIENTRKDQPIVVYCYHGMSSQLATQFLIEQGFERVYSLIGGYTDWEWDTPS